ncbi:MAG: hypothetical protein FWE40_04395 [Oscillospiraceae bacterium]|nr:hypothetical protein [Oscillospiraceae bacterium]
MKILLAVLLCLAMLGMFACAVNETVPAQQEITQQEPQRTGQRTVRERASVHESMPEFTFAFTGDGYVFPLTPYCDWPSGFLSITNIDISSEDGFHQHITLEPVRHSGYIDGFGDLNQDGYLDFWLVAGEAVWLWCPPTGKFVENDTLREFAPFGFDWDTGLLFRGQSPGDLYSKFYRYQDGEIALAWQQRRTRCPETNNVIYEYFERIGDEMVLVQRDTIDGQRIFFHLMESEVLVDRAVRTFEAVNQIPRRIHD